MTGFVNGGGGTVSISLLGPDHWQVMVADSRIGNATGPGLSLAYTEPEPVLGFTAYNNIQVLSVVPGLATFDVLSDEISPYATVLPDSATFPIQGTDIETIFLHFSDVADSVPEPGSGLLLGLGVAGVVFKRRR